MSKGERIEMFKGLKRLIGNVFWNVVEELYEVHKHREMAINPNHLPIRDIGVNNCNIGKWVITGEENLFDSLELELMKIESKEMVENLLLTMDLHLG